MKKNDVIFIVLLIIIVFGIYWKTFNYELIWDSKIYLKKNLLFSENYPISSALKFGYFREQIGVSDVDFYYRPLLTLSFFVENKLWGLKNVGLRLTNLIIYILSLIFLYIFFKNQSEKKYFPEIATILFALYPLNVDNIVWVLGRNDLFLLLWGSLTFLFLEFFVKKGKYHFLICSSFFYFLGVFSKEAFIFFLPLLILYEIIKRKKIFIPYHITNVCITIFFFILKNKILGIKSMNLIFSSEFTENIRIAIAALGYYFRSIFFPIYYDMFLSINEAMNLIYLGIIAFLVFIYLLFLSIKDKEIIIPLCFILVFLGGHILLVFTSVFPFKLYSRYMMIPALGLVWIFTKYISQIKEKIKLSLVLILLLLFIPSIIINANSYKSELSFFQKAHKSSPRNGYLLFKMANVLLEKKDFLGAELFLNQALQYSQRTRTAMLVSLLYADIEYRRSDYEKVYMWINSIKNFASSPDVELAPLMKSQISLKEALVYIALANFESAEKLLKENIERYRNQKETYDILYKMYVGYNQWEKAKNLEKTMKDRFASFRSLDTAQTKKEFALLSTENKIGFYILNNNILKAASLIKTLSPLNLDHKILLFKLYYVGGKEEEAKNTINEILTEYPNDYKALNTIGTIYLKQLIRVNEALFYYRKSLEINKDQPEIDYLITYLTDTYLNKLKETWPDKTQ